MKCLTILLLLISRILLAQDTFQTSINGLVTNDKKGQLLFYEINSRIGDMEEVSYKKSAFNHVINSEEYKIYNVAFESDVYDDGNWLAFPLILEPGAIEIKLVEGDSILSNSNLTGRDTK